MSDVENDTAATNTAPEEAPSVAPTENATVEDAPVEAEGDWSKVLIVAAGDIPSKEKRPVIVVETRDDKGHLEKGRTYPTKGAVYYRTSEEVDFGDKRSPVVTLGVDVRQGALWGLSEAPDFIAVGPASPVYGAINLAFQRGARKIEVSGLTDAQKAQLEPWLTHLRERGVDNRPTAPKLDKPFELEVTLS